MMDDKNVFKYLGNSEGMKIVVIGAGGQLGSDLVRVLKENNEVIPLYHNSVYGERLDIEDYDAVDRVLSFYMPDIVINASAFHIVDICEVEKDKAFSVNAHAVRNLAEVCNRLGATIVHISTDYVFDGSKEEPYTEEDLPNPLSVYGRSKLAGEKAINLSLKYYLIRTSYLYGDAGRKEGRTNLIETLLKLGKKGEVKAVFDNRISLTYTRDLAEKISELIKTKEYGLYHLTNSGSCSVYDLVSEINDIVGISPKIVRVSDSEFSSAPGKAPRPLKSDLTSINLKKAGLSPMRPWQDSLREYLKQEIMETNNNELKVNLDINQKIEPNNQVKIEGVDVVNRVTHSDDRGYLTEIYRVDEPYHEKYGGPLRQVYLVENDVKGIIRAFHKHQHLWDFFSISNGSAKFILIDDRPDSETYGKMNVFVLNAKNKGLIIVPPGVFHGWMSLSDNTQLLSIASHTYNHKKPDEARIPPESFATEWEVKGR